VSGAGKAAAATGERVGRLTCPKCGSDANAGHLRYVETIQCWRRVIGAGNGAVGIEGEYETGEGYDDGEDAHFECHSPDAPGGWCGHRWPVPEWVYKQIEWDPHDHCCDDECRSNGCSARFV
jgi:hypothetical protein